MKKFHITIGVYCNTYTPHAWESQSDIIDMSDLLRKEPVDDADSVAEFRSGDGTVISHNLISEALCNLVDNFIIFTNYDSFTEEHLYSPLSKYYHSIKELPDMDLDLLFVSQGSSIPPYAKKSIKGKIINYVFDNAYYYGYDKSLCWVNYDEPRSSFLPLPYSYFPIDYTKKKYILLLVSGPNFPNRGHTDFLESILLLKPIMDMPVVIARYRNDWGTSLRLSRPVYYLYEVNWLSWQYILAQSKFIIDVQPRGVCLSSYEAALRGCIPIYEKEINKYLFNDLNIGLSYHRNDPGKSDIVYNALSIWDKNLAKTSANVLWDRHNKATDTLIELLTSILSNA